MDTITYTHDDHFGWDSGPWDGEPDKVQFPDPETGLPCLLHRSPLGHWCGYVGVAEGHPLFETPYGEDLDLDVHGGITYADFCTEGEDEGRGICHIPAEGEPERVWWIGFDCAHSGDIGPGDDGIDDLGLVALRNALVDPVFSAGPSYKDQGYVMAECASLARQLVEAAKE